MKHTYYTMKPQLGATNGRLRYTHIHINIFIHTNTHKYMHVIKIIHYYNYVFEELYLVSIHVNMAVIGIIFTQTLNEHKKGLTIRIKRGEHVF